MKFTQEQLTEVELSFNKVKAYEGSQIIDSNYSRSLFDGIENDLINVGTAYRYGVGVKKNPDKAIKYFLEAIKLGSGEAALQLGHIFKHDGWWWGRKSYRFNADDCYKTAINLWKKEAEKGNHNAAWSLYYKYRHRPKEAEKWSSLAIKLAEKLGDEEQVRFMKGILNERKD